jgi:hypothetical protein
MRVDEAIVGGFDEAPVAEYGAAEVGEGLEMLGFTLVAALTVAALLYGFVQLYHGGRIGLDEDGFRTLCHSAIRRLFDGITA